MTSRALLIRLVLYSVLLVLALKFRQRMQQLPPASPASPMEVTMESKAQAVETPPPMVAPPQPAP